MISAHRGFEREFDPAAEYVEFDVQRCADGVFVVFHDDVVVRDGRDVAVAALSVAELEQVVGEVLRYEDALRRLAGWRLAHIDLKFVSPAQLYARAELTYEVQAAQLAQTALGEGAFILTSLEDQSVWALRDWAEQSGLSLLVGLSLGRDLSAIPRLHRVRVRLSELFPARRIAACGANLVVAHRRLARARLARWAARHDLPLLVWTVDDPGELARWLADPRVWLLTTNNPALATQIRDRSRHQAGA